MSRQRHRTLSPLVHEPEIMTSRPPHSATIEARTQPEPTEHIEGQVTVISGAHLQSFPFAGMSVAQACVLVEQLMSLHPDAPTIVNGNSVDSGYELQQGDTLEFVHHAGEKGHGCWTRA